MENIPKTYSMREMDWITYRTLNFSLLTMLFYMLERNYYDA